MFRVGILYALQVLKRIPKHWHDIMTVIHALCFEIYRWTIYTNNTSFRYSLRFFPIRLLSLPGPCFLAHHHWTLFSILLSYANQALNSVSAPSWFFFSNLEKELPSPSINLTVFCSSSRSTLSQHYFDSPLHTAFTQSHTQLRICWRKISLQASLPTFWWI